MGMKVFAISAVSGKGVKELLYHVNDLLKTVDDAPVVFEPEIQLEFEGDRSLPYTVEMAKMCIRDRLCSSVPHNEVLRVCPSADHQSWRVMIIGGAFHAVSYTHLDVYKRQILYRRRGNRLF